MPPEFAKMVGSIDRQAGAMVFAMVTLDTCRALHEHDHKLAAYCPTCERCTVLDLERTSMRPARPEPPGRGDIYRVRAEMTGWRLARWNTQVAELEAEVQNLVAAIGEGMISPALRQRLQTAEAELEHMRSAPKPASVETLLPRLPALTIALSTEYGGVCGRSLRVMQSQWKRRLAGGGLWEGQRTRAPAVECAGSPILPLLEVSAMT